MLIINLVKTVINVTNALPSLVTNGPNEQTLTADWLIGQQFG